MFYRTNPELGYVFRMNPIDVLVLITHVSLLPTKDITPHYHVTYGIRFWKINIARISEECYCQYANGTKCAERKLVETIITRKWKMSVTAMQDHDHDGKCTV